MVQLPRSSGWLLLPLLTITTTVCQASIPVLICVNERASADECKAEKASAALALAPWFEEFAPARARRLVDCTRFCHTVNHFTFHAPCDCETRRYLAEEDIAPGPSSIVEAKPHRTPIQLLNDFVALLPGGRCKDEVFSKAKCVVNFVSSYQYDKDALAEESNLENVLGQAREPDKGTNEPNVIDVETFDPTTYGTETVPADGLGEIIETETWDPETNAFTPGSVIDVETYDPNTEEVEQGTSSTTVETEGTTASTTETSGDAVVDATEEAIAESIGAVIDEEIVDPSSYDPDTEEVEEGNFNADTTTDETSTIDATVGTTPEVETTDGETVIDEEIVDLSTFDPATDGVFINPAIDGVHTVGGDGETVIDEEIFDISTFDPATDGVHTSGEDGGRN